jgi:hypothetical protein
MLSLSPAHADRPKRRKETYACAIASSFRGCSIATPNEIVQVETDFVLKNLISSGSEKRKRKKRCESKQPFSQTKQVTAITCHAMSP